MALPIQLTPELIHQTANELQNDGIRPTLANIRERLGGGSFTTISEAMKSWKQEQQTTAQLEKVVIPDDLNNRLNLLGAELWETAQSFANERLSKEREALQHKEALLTGEVEDYKKVVDTLESEQVESLTQLDTLTNERDFLLSELEQIQTKKEEIEQDNEQLRYKYTFESDRANDLLKSWTAERDKTNAQAETISTLTAEKAKLEANLTHANTDISRLTAILDEQKANHDKQLATITDKLESMTASNSTLSNDNAKLQGMLETLQNQSQQALDREQSLQNKIDELMAKLTQPPAQAQAHK